MFLCFEPLNRRRFGGALVSCIFVASLAWAQPVGNIGNLAKSSKSGSEIANQPSGGSMIDEFRRLLAMTPSDRERALAQKPEEKRKILHAKITEYLGLSPEEREVRLRLVELWSYLEPLMRLEQAQRAERLARVPEADRPLIEERLKEWDLLPPAFQEKALENEAAIQYFARFEAAVARSTVQTPNNSSSAALRSPLEEKLQQWHAVPEQRRERMYQHFQEFFEMPANQKRKTLNILSDEERQKLEKSLRTFEQLPAHQREAFIESFRKFENMSKEERDQFLNNAERWRAMSAQDRQTWINLMNLLPSQPGPPMPPGAGGGRKPPGEGVAPKALPKLPGANSSTEARPPRP